MKKTESESTTPKKDPQEAASTEKKSAASNAKPKHCHYGHRERMRNRFLKSGLDRFQPHEILEIMLFYALPRANTNEIAHELIYEFHSFSEVLDADLEDLTQIKGISEYAAVFLKLLPQLCWQYQLDKIHDLETLDTVEKLCIYVKAQLFYAVQEQVLLLCLDESLYLLHYEIISTGDTQSVMLDAHRIVACAMQKRSSRIVLAHNHPHAKADFSDADLFATKQLKRSLFGVQVQLLDHIVVGRNGDTASMKMMGLL